MKLFLSVTRMISKKEVEDVDSKCSNLTFGRNEKTTMKFKMKYDFAVIATTVKSYERKFQEQMNDSCSIKEQIKAGIK